MSSSVPGWVTTLFCPLLGTLISNAVGLAPVRAVLDARKNKKLGLLIYWFSITEASQTLITIFEPHSALASMTIFSSRTIA